MSTADWWTSVSDGLPDDNLNVLVWNGSDVWMAYHATGDGWCYIDGMPVENVTHWQHTPEPPRCAQPTVAFVVILRKPWNSTTNAIKAMQSVSPLWMDE